MASTDELVAQASAADTTDQLDALQAASSDPAVAQAVQTRRDTLNAASVTPTATQQPTPAAVLADNPNLSTEPADPRKHFFIAQDGKTKINAWGEQKGSEEDRKRMASL